MSGYLGAMAATSRDSGFVDGMDVAPQAALAVGAGEILQKPLLSRDLARSLAKVLGRS
jgi:hypothetical protein